MLLVIILQNTRIWGQSGPSIGTYCSIWAEQIVLCQFLSQFANTCSLHTLRQFTGLLALNNGFLSVCWTIAGVGKLTDPPQTSLPPEHNPLAPLPCCRLEALNSPPQSVRQRMGGGMGRNRRHRGKSRTLTGKEPPVAHKPQFGHPCNILKQTIWTVTISYTVHCRQNSLYLLPEAIILQP